jgi:hypothetical protein
MIFGLAVVLMAGLAALTIPRAGADSEEAKLRTLVPKIIGSWESLDITKIEPYYAADAGFAYFDIVPLKYNNWAEYRAGAQKALFEPNRSIILRKGPVYGVSGTLRIQSGDKSKSREHVPARPTSNTPGHQPAQSIVPRKTLDQFEDYSLSRP